jgi:hypothetical protein
MQPPDDAAIGAAAGRIGEPPDSVERPLIGGEREGDAAIQAGRWLGG